MSSAIVINLDYENNSEAVCQEIWDAIRQGMLKAGFHLDNRVFIMNQPHTTVCTLASDTVRGTAQPLGMEEKDLLGYLKDFYAYDLAHTDNLLVSTGR